LAGWPCPLGRRKKKWTGEMLTGSLSLVWKSVL